MEVVVVEEQGQHAHSSGVLKQIGLVSNLMTHS